MAGDDGHQGREDQGVNEWLGIHDAARQVRVRVETIRVWAVRGKVRTVGTGPTRIVHMGDLMAAEHAWRTRVSDKRGARV